MKGDPAVLRLTVLRPTVAGSPGAVAHAVLLGSGAGRDGPVLRPDQRAEGGIGCGRISAVPVRAPRGMVGQPIGYARGSVTQRDRPAAECTRSGTRPSCHDPHSIHYSPVLPVLCAGGEMLR